MPAIILIPFIIFMSCNHSETPTGFGDPPVPETCFCDPDGVEAYLQWISQNYTGITELRTIGYSENDRSLFVLEISDKPGITEDEPAVLINGGIHGHEQIGTGIPMKLAEYLVQAYYTGDAGAEYIVDNLKLHIMPTLNPDGLAASRRYNSNFVDLNRNFGWNWDSSQSNNGEYPFDQRESRAVRDDFADYGYCLSLNLHTSYSWGSSGTTDGGAGIYAPWDAIETSETDFENQYLQNYPFIKTLGEDYADRVVASDIYPFDYYFHYQEGADWYPFWGSMGDWALGVHGTASYSIELYGDQYFSVEDSDILDSTWEAHKEALINIILSAEAGTGGIVVDTNGQPVAGAEITLDNTSGSRSLEPIPYPDLKTLSDASGQFRLLTDDGSYSLTISKSGYADLSTQITVSTSSSRGLTDTGSGTDYFYPEYILYAD